MANAREDRKNIISEYVKLKIWPLNPSGNFENVLDVICTVDENNAPVYTAEIVGQRYIDYFNKWTTEHVDQEERFIGQNDKLLDVYSFILKRMYENEYSIIKKGRDFYLFGNLTKEELKDKLNNYKQSIKHGRK